jgi:LytS/YehU family sensor histidine kinase
MVRQRAVVSLAQGDGMVAQLKIGRTILGVFAGYVTNALLVGITEAIYARFLDGRKYFVVDLLTQIFATIIGAYLCCFIAQRGRKIAAISLTILGLIIGFISLVMTWNAEPHWYGIALLSVYGPCVWTVYTLMPGETK